MTDADTAIDVQNLTKVYGAVRAVDDVSFSVGRGQIVGFLGPNGAGKSTTMRILCGITMATSGRASICGISVAARPDQVKRKIGYMPEQNPLPEDLRVVEYLRYRARLKEVPRRKLRAAVDEVMEICDLQRKARRRVIGTLSKGFRQRVGIADALLAEPEVIIMDEPTIGLDPHQILGIRALIDRLRGRMTVILSSHILPEIELLCDKVVIINQGRVVGDGTPAALRREFIGRTAYRVVLKEQVAGIEEALRAVAGEGAAISTVPGDSGQVRCRVDVDRDDLGAEFIARLSAIAGGKLVEVAREVPSLEDIFLAATRRSWMETGIPPHVDEPAPEPAAVEEGGGN